MKKVEITVKRRTVTNPKGGIAVEAHGYSGQGCVVAVEFYTGKLGKVDSSEPKAEYFQQEEGTQENTA
jgi:hypothetical protein